MMQRATSTISSWLGLTGGSLSPKYGNTASTTLRQAQRAFLALNKNIPNNNNHDDNSVLYCTHDTIEFEELCQFMGKAWVGCARTGVAGEPLKEWMTSHIGYPCTTTQQQLAVYYMGASIAQSMRQETGCMVLGQRCPLDKKLVAAMIVCEHQRNRPHDKLATAGTKPFSYWQDEWWELGVTLRLASLAVPDTLLRCHIYQEQQRLSALKGAALANVKQEYYTARRNKYKTTEASTNSSTTTKSNNKINHDSNNNTYWSVEMVAIDPARQGKGHGKALVSNLCNLADAAAVPCHLESASRRNTQFYQQAGFSIRSTLTVPDPTAVNGAALDLSLMRRWPVLATRAAAGAVLT